MGSTGPKLLGRALWHASFSIGRNPNLLLGAVH